MLHLLTNAARPRSHYFYITREARDEWNAARRNPGTEAHRLEGASSERRHLAVNVFTAAGLEGLTLVPRLVTGTRSDRFGGLVRQGPAEHRPSAQSLGLLGLTSAGVSLALAAAVGVCAVLLGTALGAAVGACLPSKSAQSMGHQGARWGASAAFACGSTVFSVAEVARSLLCSALDLAGFAVFGPIEMLAEQALNWADSCAFGLREADLLLGVVGL